MITRVRISSEEAALSQSGCFNQEVEIDHSGMLALNYQPHEYHVETGTEISKDALSPSYSFLAKIEIDDDAGETVIHFREIWVNFISDID